ncbi:MAG TPA: hypothetical protein ENJ95_01620 [Bacteroidetes bacterium]|nr:hypothetical protein [Bacteroidota bacterium]
MKIQKLFFSIFVTCGILLAANIFSFAQTDGARISGNLELNSNFFIRDTSINAANTPQYDRQLYGADAYLNLNYSNKGFDVGLRFDMFQNSFLLNPTGSYTAQGIGNWYVKKKINKLGITGGYFYDIIGSGIIFRAYESRALAIDQALYGLRLTYDLTASWQLKAFTGRQKKQFGTYESNMRGFAADGFVRFDSANVTLAPGFGAVSRTLDDNSMNNLVATLNTYRKEDIFIPKYSTYAFSVYNTLTAGPFSWYVEGAYKTEDTFNSPLEERTTVSGDTVVGRFVQDAGTVFYTSLSYSAKGLGVTLEAKRTEHFDFRARPQAQGIQGLVHYLPPMTRVNTYRLPARYSANIQFEGEKALQLDVRYRFSKKLTVALNASNIALFNNDELYREVFTEFYYKYKRKWTLTAGAQYQEYNQDIYQGKPGVPFVTSFTPYFDFLYKIERKKAIRFEGQFMHVDEDKKHIKADYGNWAFGLLEYTMAPHWTFTVSDMYNIAPGKLSPENAVTRKKEKIHYPRFDIYYTHRTNRFSISYVKQVEGIVCSGGICRLEPAFNGVKVSVNSSF